MSCFALGATGTAWSVALGPNLPLSAETVSPAAAAASPRASPRALPSVLCAGGGSARRDCAWAARGDSAGPETPVRGIRNAGCASLQLMFLRPYLRLK